MTPSRDDIAPPHPPWKELQLSSEPGGYLSIYYSDDISRLPVRWVTKPGDNKSDPNLETLTYGLFSTCWRAMRSGIVTRGWPHLFFATSWKSRRVLAGYYRVRWYSEGALGAGDYCLAADRARFIESPIPLKEVDRRCGTKISGPFRSVRLLEEDECKRMCRLVDAQPDMTHAYLNEIDRLERFNLMHGGYRYISWQQTEKFSWQYANKYFSASAESPSELVANASPSGIWKCSSCQKEVKNKALLKRCPNCGKLATLRPKL